MSVMLPLARMHDRKILTLSIQLSNRDLLPNKILLLFKIFLFKFCK